MKVCVPLLLLSIQVAGTHASNQGYCTGTTSQCSVFSSFSTCAPGSQPCKWYVESESCTSDCGVVMEMEKCTTWQCTWVDPCAGMPEPDYHKGCIESPCHEVVGCDSRLIESECTHDGACYWCPCEIGLCYNTKGGPPPYEGTVYGGFCNEPLTNPFPLCGSYLCGCDKHTTEEECLNDPVCSSWTQPAMTKEEYDQLWECREGSTTTTVPPTVVTAPTSNYPTAPPAAITVDHESTAVPPPATQHNESSLGESATFKRCDAAVSVMAAMVVGAVLAASGAM